VRIDATAPASSCSADPSTLWPPNNKLVAVTTSVDVSDDGSGPDGFVLTSATSDEPGADDIQSFTTGEADVNGFLRAQRLGSGSGRVYTLRYTAADVAGNTSRCEAHVRVPHDQGD